MTIEIEKLIAIGGREWKAGDKHRIYFNDAATLAGFDYERYGTGKISSVRKDGEKLSNSKGGRRVECLNAAKLHYDVVTGKIVYTYLGPEEGDAQDAVTAIRAAIQ